MNATPAFQEKLPSYGEKPPRPGMYLGLLHGRDHPQQQMNDWGFNGPMIGPLKWFHTTYTCTVRIAFESAADGQRYFGERRLDGLPRCPRGLRTASRFVPTRAARWEPLGTRPLPQLTGHPSKGRYSHFRQILKNRVVESSVPSGVHRVAWRDHDHHALTRACQ